MTPDEAQSHAAAALRLWGCEDGAPHLIRNRENAVFRVRLANGNHAALRLHRAGYQTDPAIRSELVWTEALADIGIPCPRPIRTETGDLLGAPAFGPRASLVTWIDADPIATDDVPFAGTPAQQAGLYQRIGGLVAAMHRGTDTCILPPDFERPRWDLDGLSGETPLWGCFWRNPALNDREADELDGTRRDLRAELENGTWDTGLIHADLLQENVLIRDDALHVIDFDDSGVGFRLYDLGTAMIQHCDAPNCADLSAALCDGYGGGHDHIAMFTLARALASCGWVVPRTGKDDPRRRTYADRALRLARAWR